MEKTIIELAKRICKNSFMDYPDFDPDVEMDLATALTVMVQESTTNTDDIEMSEVYDFISSKLKD